ncbi:hypothetical protein ACJX0J_025501, partial [Zea mays]
MQENVILLVYRTTNVYCYVFLVHGNLLEIISLMVALKCGLYVSDRFLKSHYNWDYKLFKCLLLTIKISFETIITIFVGLIFFFYADWFVPVIEVLIFGPISPFTLTWFRLIFHLYMVDL